MSLTSELLKERKSPEKWQEEVDALTAKIAELEQENACLREELQKLKRKEKPIRFDSLADWGRE